jgi:hypothetical protein
MTSRISLIIGIAVTALAVGVPTAFGEGRIAGSLDPQTDFWNYDATGTRIANTSPGVAPQDLAAVHGFATLSLVSRPDSHEVNRPLAYIDAAERAERASALQGRVVLLSGDDHVTVAPADTSTPSASSGREFDWPQVGIALGIGIALAFGLILAFRSRQRPLAH